MFTVFKKSEMVEGALDAVWRAMAWSFNHLLEGKWPSQNIHGRAIAGGGKWLADGWRGALCQACADWAFYCEVFGFPQWNAAERMCWLCRASSTIPELVFSRFGPDAGWRSTRWTHETYIEYLRAAGLAIPALLIAIVGFRLECVMIDTLHTVDQGVASHIVANVIWLVVVQRKKLGGTTQESQIAAVNEHLRRWYQSAKRGTNKIQGKVTVQRVRTSGGWPKLKAKAAARRHLAAYALHLMTSHGNPADRKELAVCQLLVRFYEILDNESMYLSPAANRELVKVGSQLCILYTSLAADAAHNGSKMWKCTPKRNLFAHLCEWQAGEAGNPRFCWPQADEDLDGLLVEVAESCHPLTMSVSALFKWVHTYFE